MILPTQHICLPDILVGEPLTYYFADYTNVSAKDLSGNKPANQTTTVLAARWAGILRKEVTKNGQWPADKNELITKHLEPFLNYTESIDFDQL